MGQHKPIALGTVVALAALSLVACGRGQQRPQFPPPAAGFIVVKEQPVPLAIELPGRTSPFAVSEVRPQVSGIIKQRLFTEGSLVKAGQPLYQIDPAPYRAAYDSAAANLASAKAKAERYAVLARQNAVAPLDNDNAQAAYKQAQAAVETAKINLDYTRITAPIGGRIGASSVTQGALVTANQANALAVISTLDPIYVDIDQSSNDVLALKRATQAGQVDARNSNAAKVTLTLDDGSTYDRQGKLQFTDVTVDQTTGTVRLRAIFPNPAGLLLPGLYVRATLVQGTDPHGILVPQLAIGRDAKGQATGLVLDEKNFARLRFLKTGRVLDGQWQVLDGLKPGDRLVVEGLAKIMPDMPVQPQPIAATAAPKPAGQ
jgi:membrane fusion protein (multidrug efflux system)